MKSLPKILIQNTHQPSEPDVAQISTVKDEISLDKDMLLKLSLILIESLQRNVLSGDAWMLSYSRMIDQAQRLDIDNDSIKNFIDKIEEARQNRFKANPLSCMF